MTISSMPYFFHHGRDIFLAAHHRHSLKPGAGLLGIVVDDAGDLPVQVPAVFHLPEHHKAPGAGPHDHGHYRLPLGNDFFPMADPQETVGKPGHDHQHRQQKDVDDDIAPGHPQVQEPHARHLQAGGYDHGKYQVLKFHDAGEAPETGVHAEQGVHRQGAGHIEPHVLPDGIPERGFDILKTKVKTHPQSPRHAHDHHDRVQQKEQQPTDHGFPVLRQFFEMYLHVTDFFPVRFLTEIFYHIFTRTTTRQCPFSPVKMPKIIGEL